MDLITDQTKIINAGKPKGWGECKSYGIVMGCVGISGEDDRKSGDEEKSEHGGYKNPVREEVPHTH